jgi:hypothetical protein
MVQNLFSTVRTVPQTVVFDQMALRLDIFIVVT